MTELGHTQDPAKLIPGDPDALTRAARAYQLLSNKLDDTAAVLRRQRVAMWTGAAAAAFYDNNAAAASRIAHLASTNDTLAATAMESAKTIASAQRQAREAISLWNSSQPRTPRSHPRDDSDYTSPPHPGPEDASNDSGENDYGGGSDKGDEGSQSAAQREQQRQNRLRAQEILARARAHVRENIEDATPLIRATLHPVTRGPSTKRGSIITTPAVHPRHATSPTATRRHPAATPPHPRPTPSHPATAPAASPQDDGWRPLGPPPHPAPRAGDSSPTTAPAAADPAASSPAAPAEGGCFPPQPAPPPAPGWVASLPPGDPRRAQRYVVVAPPAGGVHDSIYRIAQRELGDGNRWHEIEALNHNLPQPDGHTLQQPTLVHPGWILAVPTHPTAALSPDAVPGDLAPAVPPSTPMPSAPLIPGPAPGSPAGHGLLTPLALAAGATGVGLGVWGLASRGGHSTPRRKTHTTTAQQPTHGVAPADGPVAEDSAHRNDVDGGDPFHTPDWAPLSSQPTQDPSGYPHNPQALMDLSTQVADPAPPGRSHPAARSAPPLARQHESQTSDAAVDDAAHPAGTRRSAGAGDGPIVTDSAPHPALDEPVDNAPAVPVLFGMRGSQRINLDLAAQRGLGLTGPGADAAARALLAALLLNADPPVLREPTAPHTTTSQIAQPVTVLITQSLARRLLGDHLDVTALSTVGLQVSNSLVSALERLEEHIPGRARASRDNTDITHRPLVLFADPEPHHQGWLQSVLETGSGYAIAGVLTAEWPAGTTCDVAVDGTITTATGPAASTTLSSARMLTAERGQLTDLLATRAAATAREAAHAQTASDSGEPPRFRIGDPIRSRPEWRAEGARKTP
jgi:hypothetical protein